MNVSTLMGRLCADPVLKKTPSDVSVTTFTLAVNRNYAKQGEQRQADFIDIVAWRGTAEFVARHFTKGAQVVISGSIQTRIWVDKEGNNRKAFEVVADDVFFADSKPQSKSVGAEPTIGDEPTGFVPIENNDELPF